MSLIFYNICCRCALLILYNRILFSFSFKRAAVWRTFILISFYHYLVVVRVNLYVNMLNRHLSVLFLRVYQRFLMLQLTLLLRDLCFFYGFDRHQTVNRLETALSSYWSIPFGLSVDSAKVLASFLNALVIVLVLEIKDYVLVQCA